uniref:mRNA m(6)A methyltransferase n=1 Tax=Plectus sambesii TaxID=2011161 RepID=A0A914V9U7_9BILA
MNKSEPKDSIEALLSAPSAREKETRKVTNEILDLLNKPTAKELALIDKFKSDGSSMHEFCPRGTKRDCAKASPDNRYCERLHFRKIVQKHTDHSLGDCSFLNTCFHMDTCKYIHYEVDYSTSTRNDDRKKTESQTALMGVGDAHQHQMLPPQWVQCDMRLFDLSVLGTFSVVMADPPWDIHMELPYGTMSDDEMRRLNVQCLQTEGLIFLWVTGRAMELGRECLRLWGYKQCDEIIWVKTNQLQRIIRTGRTGHWLNHGKEHCLVGIKGSLDKFHVGLDCDVIVAEVRATSHKPDEIYGIIERLSPGTRKIELFGRQHNVQPNWITLGNQLDGVRLVEPDIVARFRDRYPDGNCMPKPEEIILLKQKKPPQRGRGRGGRRF